MDFGGSSYKWISACSSHQRILALKLWLLIKGDAVCHLVSAVWRVKEIYSFSSLAPYSFGQWWHHLKNKISPDKVLLTVWPSNLTSPSKTWNSAIESPFYRLEGSKVFLFLRIDLKSVEELESKVRMLRCTLHPWNKSCVIKSCDSPRKKTWNLRRSWTSNSFWFTPEHFWNYHPYDMILS